MKCSLSGLRNVIFTEEDIKVRDHSHMSGNFRGAAHQSCNLNYQEAHHIPIIFHNMSNYDIHFIIKGIAINFPNRLQGDVSIIPCTDERYISFTKTIMSAHQSDYKRSIKLRFIDSLRFMPRSLDYLSSLLPQSEKKILCREFSKEYDENHIHLLQRKGVFCYDYVDSWSKLKKKSLPPKNKFYSRLNECDVSDQDYEFAQNIWRKFNIETLGDYSDLYMKTDILLLADVFENFRTTCFNIYKLDPAHYYTTPGLSFDAMLKYTQVRIELITDVDMLLFVERGVRGGISQCSKRYAKANNKYMSEFEANETSNFLMYLDANNLYGHAMMQYLPVDGYEWCYDEFSTEKILSIPDDSPVGYVFEVDLEYPQSLHDLHKDYPFCSENANVPYTKERKLLLTLYDKKNYVIHYKMLKSVLRHGLILRKIHRVMKFNQSQWLKPYVDLNTELRTRATNEFEKEFFKLLINAIYGKTMENVRARADIRLKNKWYGPYGARQLIAKPNFKRFKIFDKDLVAIELNKTSIEMNKPILVGMAVLDISKVLMYDFYYGHLKKKYNDKVCMLYTDTDSFVLEVNTDCFYNDMKENLEMYDTSNLPENNIYNMPLVNKKVPGLFKDEMNGKIMTEFVGLRSKMYSIRSQGDEKIEEMKRAKGVKKCVLQKTINFDHYLKCLKENCIISCYQNSIRSRNHSVYTVKQKKIALSAMDNKRFISSDNITTLPWGHCDIVNCGVQHVKEMKKRKKEMERITLVPVTADALELAKKSRVDA